MSYKILNKQFLEIYVETSIKERDKIATTRISDDDFKSAQRNIIDDKLRAQLFGKTNMPNEFDLRQFFDWGQIDNIRSVYIDENAILNIVIKEIDYNELVAIEKCYCFAFKHSADDEKLDILEEIF